MLQLREIKNESEYHPLMIVKNAPLTQAWFFGEWQEAMGRKARRFEITENSEAIGFFQAVKYPLILNEKFLYIPHASILRSDYEERLDIVESFSAKLNEIAKEENAAFARFDFYFHNSIGGSKKDFWGYFKKTPDYAYNSAYFQPKHEWILNVENSEEELFKGMYSKTRYCIRLAESKGVSVEIIKSDLQKYFEKFYELMQKTAERNKFNLHPKIYYQNIFDNCEKNKNSFLVFAEYKGNTVAANLILLYGETAYFVFGASGNEFKNLMAPHLAHWKGILEAKRRGFKIYNFGAVSAADNGRFEGISRFKKRFGGSLLEYSDSYDLVFKPIWYHLYDFKRRLI